MRKRRNIEHIRRLLEQARIDQAQGLTAADIARKLGIAKGTLFRWRKELAGRAGEDADRVRQLEHEVERLQRLVAELALEKQMLQDIAKKKW
jgi:putative transposase